MVDIDQSANLIGELAETRFNRHIWRALPPTLI